MNYIVTWMDDMFDGMGSAIDDHYQSFADITDAMQLVHELTTHPHTQWCDDDGYHMSSDIFDVKLSFQSNAD